MASANRLWGAERIRGELLKLGIRVSKRTVQKYMRAVRKGTPGGQRWSTFLRNHARETWACDFLQAYDVFFRPIFAFVFIELATRRIMLAATTRFPSQAFGHTLDDPVRDVFHAEASLRSRYLMRGAPDVRSVDRYFAALVRSECAEHRRRRATRDASRALQERLRRQHHEADHAQRARSAEPALWLRQALDLIAVQWLPSARHLLFDGNGLGVGWMCGALDLLLRRHGCLATDDIAAGVLGQFRLASLPALGDDGVNAVALLLQRELAQAHARYQPDLAHDPACAIRSAIGLFTRSPPPNPLRI